MNEHFRYTSTLGAAFVIACGVALAQDPNECDVPGEAPDLVLVEITHTGRFGTIGDITSYGFGTHICNRGTCQADWDTSGNHPLISQGLYRLKNGRFEQIGQSWVKHTWFAYQLNLCETEENPCIPTSGGNHLGVNCSDPYNNGENGWQARLGPRSEIDPVTATWPFPFTGMDQTGNEIYKRLQVHQADLEPTLNSGASYFGEVHYVSRDDILGGNRDNSVSYRPVSVFAFQGAYYLNLAGPTQVGTAVLAAWAAADPSVQYKEVMVDGKLILATKVTSVGGGRWRYEYALQNVYSHRGVGSFRVDLPNGSAATSIGFHDVEYHSGETVSNLDWPGQNVPGGVVWSTTPFSADPNANALRWGTLYNYRFESTAPPASHEVHLELFRPGVPVSVSVATLAPALCNNNAVCDAGEECHCPGECPGFSDGDGDSVIDLCDNCDLQPNAPQYDGDGDGSGDPCDPCPADAANDADADGVCGDVDICPTIHNPAQEPLVFPEWIRFTDPNTLAWNSPLAVDRVFGFLMDVQHYSIHGLFSSPGTTSVAVADEPPPGMGFYHLVKRAGACGSWQSSPGAEPGRDVLP